MPNYELERKLERFYTLKTYLSLIRQPAGPTNAARIKSLQERHLRELMEIAYRIPFYRERFEKSGTTPSDYRHAEDLYKFPVLTKDELRSWMDDELEQHPEKYASWHVAPTSGSTGRPLRVLRSPREAAFSVANWLRTMALAGYNPFTGLTQSRPNSLHAPDGNVPERDSFIQRLGILRHKYMSDTIKNRVDTQVLVDEINAVKPDYLYNHTNVLVRIAAYAKDNGIDIWKPTYYSPVSEQLTESSEQLLAEVFGPGLVNSYGLNETDSCVVRLPGRSYFQVLSDSYVVNIYDDALQNPSDAGMAVITPLAKRDLPIINYLTYDYMEGRMQDGLRYITKIQGRMNDVIYHKDGSVTEWANVSVVMNYLADVVAFRLVQNEPGHIHLLLVRHPEIPESKQPEIEQTIIEGMMPIFNDDSMTMSMEWVDDIPADPNGKLRVIVSTVDPSAIKRPQ